MRPLRAFVLHALIPALIGLIVAAVAFYIWRQPSLRRRSSTYSRLPQEVTSKDDEDEIQGFLVHPDTPLLDKDISAYEEVAVMEKSSSK
jgi:hypothetical protein